MSHPDFSHIGDPIDRVIEECGELIQAISKARRFGLFNHHPDRPNSPNFDEIRRELDDVFEACERLDAHMREIAHYYYGQHSSHGDTHSK